MSATTVMALALSFVACRATPTPLSRGGHIHLVTTTTPEGRNRDDVLAACRIWTDYLGLSCGFDASGLAECDHGWRRLRPVPRCDLSIGITFVVDLRSQAGTDAESDRNVRETRLDTRYLTGPPINLRIAVAHELGHLILDTAEHTATGVMSGTSAALSEDDKQLATRTGQ